MREIEDVVGTDDGMHVLVLCADGGAMYFRGQPPQASGLLRGSNRNDSAAASEAGNSKGLVELVGLRDKDVDQAVVLRRIGFAGHVVVLRASRGTVASSTSGPGGSAEKSHLVNGGSAAANTAGGSGSNVSIPGLLAPPINPQTHTISIQLLACKTDST
jgi:hypothetical protein